MTEENQKKKSRLETVSMDDLARELRENSEEAFRRDHPHPFMVVVYTPPSDAESKESTTAETQVDVSTPSVRRRMSKRVIPLVKSDSTSSTPRITIGRARDSDIVIRASKISKQHAEFFPGKGGRYRLMDVGSVNGTVVNSVRLEKNRAVSLKSGDMVALWLYLFQFVELEPFLILLRSNPF